MKTQKERAGATAKIRKSGSTANKLEFKNHLLSILVEEALNCSSSYHLSVSACFRIQKQELRTQDLQFISVLFFLRALAL
jgi:hypothetical protein